MTITEHHVQPQPPTWEQLKAEREAANLAEVRQLVSSWHHEDDTPGLPLSSGYDPLLAALAKALYEAEDRGPDRPRVIPELIHVHGYDNGGEAGLQLIPEDQASVYRAEGHEITLGLQCPHCGTVAWDDYNGGIYVIDVSERWSDFGYEVSMVDEFEPKTAAEKLADRGLSDWKATGRQVERRAIVGGYDDSNHQGEGYACGACARRVSLPEDVEEVGS